MLTSVTSHLLLLKFIHFYCSNHVAWCPIFCFALNLVARHLVATSHGLAETHCEGWKNAGDVSPVERMKQPLSF